MFVTKYDDLSPHAGRRKSSHSVVLCRPHEFFGMHAHMHTSESACTHTQLILLCFVCFCFFEIRFLCVVLAVLDLALVDQAGLKFTEIYLSLPPECWD